MHVISRKKLRDFWAKHADAEGPLKAWFLEAKKADWKDFTAVKAMFRSADYVGNNRVVFNIGGNKYRLVVMFHFGRRVAYIRFVGTHAQYNKIDAASV